MFACGWIAYLATGRARSWRLPVVALGAFAVLMVVLCVIGWWMAPVTPSRLDVIGTYEVNRKIYPGPNADWQHAHYQFRITHDDQFLLYDHTFTDGPKVFRGTVWWMVEPSYRWHLNMKDPHHITNSLRKGPALYRGTEGFYYVFPSEKFGNMFFSRVSEG